MKSIFQLCLQQYFISIFMHRSTFLPQSFHGMVVMAPVVLVVQLTLFLLSVGYEITPKKRTKIDKAGSSGDSLLFIGDSQVFYGDAMSYGFLNILRHEISLVNAGLLH